MELQDYERKHSAFIRENGAESTVLLKKDRRLPLKAPGILPCTAAAHGEQSKAAPAQGRSIQDIS